MTFMDVQNTVHTLDFPFSGNVAYNADCMKFLASCPDNAFDLAVVDPPYGNCSQNSNVEREREREQIGKDGATRTGQGLADVLTVTRTGETWAAKYAKKS